ncbi:MAG: hypothetical protein PHQ23_00575 [Candidatus Wallbacteria bacterium]|nr:hypothetical protein [Candidatus Wallbacteria bacterium]
MSLNMSFAVKGSFSTLKASGAFYAEFDCIPAALKSFRCAVKSGFELSKIDLNMQIEEFRKRVDGAANSLREDDPVHGEMLKLNARITGMQQERVNRIVNLFESPGDDYLKSSLIRDQISEELTIFLKDIKGKVNIAIETGPGQENSRENPVEETEIAPPPEQEKICLEVKPELDPVNGKSSSLAKIGSKLIVKLASAEDLSKYSELFEYSRKSGDVKQARIVGRISEIIPPSQEASGRTMIELELSPGIYSRLSIGRELKLAVPSEESDDQTEPRQPRVNLLGNRQFIFTGAVLLAVLLLIGLIAVLF